MRYLAILLIILIHSIDSLAVECMTLTYPPSDDWLTVGDKTYMNLELESVTAPRRIAVKFYSRRDVIAEVWDNPNLREYNICTELDGQATTHIIGQAVAYEGGPWKPSTAYSVGDKLAIGSLNLSGDTPVINQYPSTSFWFEATTAGTSGTVEPAWPLKQLFTRSLANTLDAAAAIDNGDGTVNIPLTGHPYREGQSVVITGSVNYNSTYTLPDQTNGDVNHIVVTATYTAETFAGSESIQIANSDVIDNGDGTVNIQLPAHGYVSGDDVTVVGMDNYDGDYTLSTQSSADYLTITPTFAAETLSAEAVVDNGDGTVIIPLISQQYWIGDKVTITGTTNYDGTYTLGDQSNNTLDGFVITATYVAETFDGTETAQATFMAETITGGYAIYKTITDGTTVWTYTEGTQELFTSEPTGRIIGRVSDGRLKKSGSKFIIRNAP